jgi:hypothetical protein
MRYDMFYNTRRAKSDSSLQTSSSLEEAKYWVHIGNIDASDFHRPTGSCGLVIQVCSVYLSNKKAAIFGDFAG